jgi:hypothetical protein
MEIWKPVSGWEGYYEVSDLGNVRSLTRTAECFVRGKVQIRVHKGKFLKPGPNPKSGYLMVSFTAPGGVRDSKYVHQMVAQEFLSAANEGEEVCHRDGNRVNNVVSNLRYGTRSSNALDRHEHGTMNQARGTNHYFHKLTEDQVRRIRQLRGKLTQRELGELYGVHNSQISAIQLGKLWKHVK